MATLLRPRSPVVRAILGCAALCAPLVALGAANRTEGAVSRQSWIESPYREFRAPQPILPGRVVLFDEASDPALRLALGSELRRLFDELYTKQAWRFPFAGDEPLRVYVARRQAGGIRGMAARSVEKGKLVAPAVLLDGTGLPDARIVRDVSRQIALATLAGYGAEEDGFLETAAAEVLAGASEGGARDEETWILASAPLVDFRARPAALGRLWIDEVVREAGDPALLRETWERAAELGDSPMATLLRLLSEKTGGSEETVLVRCAARLYASLEPEASPARLRLLDLETGALDASAPSALSVRHRTFLPEGDQETLRVAWPEDGAAAAAVVRYSDAALPPDVVFFAAGERHAVPMSGVERIEFLVAGNAGGGRGLRAPAYCERTAAVPFAGLEARASAGAEGPRLTWTTSSHEGLWGWAVFREEVLSDGRIDRAGPQIVPSSERSEDSFRYVFVDSTSTPATFYRYTVWAVTDEGLLARAFSATLKTAE